MYTNGAPSSRRFKTIVVGTGPAGVMAAHAASAVGDVLMIDRSLLPRDKSCGGMLNEYSQAFLASYGDLPQGLWLDPPYVNFRYVDWDRGIRKPTKLRFANVDRAGFDEWMLSLVPGNVEIVGGVELKGFSDTGDGVVVRCGVRDGEEVELRCDYLVGADGPRSTVRRLLGTDPVATYKTLQDFCVLEAPIEPWFDCLYSHDIDPAYGYGYTIPKGDVAILGSVFFPGTKRPLDMHLKAYEAFREEYHLGETVKREAWTAIQVNSVRDIVRGQGRVYLAGEAGGFMSASSGEGISFALNSGEAIGRAIAEHPGEPSRVLERYTESTARMVKNIAFRLRMRPFMISDFGKWVAGYIPTPIVSKVTERL